ncbi:MAG: TlpA family protein disulfide reductase, partial [Fimbriimonadales bacterium]|nr:TlpA family protein disulfide reductase [Fimbriimonadales bacterium]
GTPAPDFELESLDGKTVKLSELKGKPVFLDFWATWCGPCRRALPHTQAFSEKYKGKAHIFAVNVREDKEKVQAFMEQHQYTFRVLMDPQGAVASNYGVRGIPHFVVIDAEGKVTFIKVGYGQGVEKELESALEQAIAQAEQERRASLK